MGWYGAQAAGSKQGVVEERASSLPQVSGREEGEGRKEGEKQEGRKEEGREGGRGKEGLTFIQAPCWARQHLAQSSLL